MNKTLDRALLARPLVFVLGGSMSAMVNPSMQRGNLAGWIAGSLEIVVTYPLEFVKTQLQLQVTSSARAGPRALTTQAL